MLTSQLHHAIMVTLFPVYIGSVYLLYLNIFLFHCAYRSGDNQGSTGQVKLTIGYSMEESRLFITVHACRSQYTKLNLFRHIYHLKQSMSTKPGVNVFVIHC